MNDKFLGWVFGTVIMAACCLGVPLFLWFLGSAGVFAWLGNNSLAVVGLIIIAAIFYLLHRDPKKRRRYAFPH